MQPAGLSIKDSKIDCFLFELDFSRKAALPFDAFVGRVKIQEVLQKVFSLDFG